jgi:hypothetical protein
LLQIANCEGIESEIRTLVILKRGQETGIATYSDDKGNYRLEAEPGAYILTVERDGYVVCSRTQPKTIVGKRGRLFRM